MESDSSQKDVGYKIKLPFLLAAFNSKHWIVTLLTIILALMIAL